MLTTLRGTKRVAPPARLRRDPTEGLPLSRFITGATEPRAPLASPGALGLGCLGWLSLVA